MGIHELAAAVIAEAVADLDNLGHQDKKLQKIAEDARNFLTTDRLNLWAHTIGLDPEAVQQRIKVKLGLEGGSIQNHWVGVGRSSEDSTIQKIIARHEDGKNA